jgi:hypothetical protein
MYILVKKNVARSIEFQKESDILFHFHVKYESALHVNFRSPEDQRIFVQLILEEKAETIVCVLYYG